MDYFGADREARGANYEGQVNASSSRGFEDPVKGELDDCVLVLCCEYIYRMFLEMQKAANTEDGRMPEATSQTFTAFAAVC